MPTCKIEFSNLAYRLRRVTFFIKNIFTLHFGIKVLSGRCYYGRDDEGIKGLYPYSFQIPPVFTKIAK